MFLNAKDFLSMLTCFQREKQGGVWTRGGEVAAPQPSYSDPYGAQPEYSQTPMPQHAPSLPPPNADPYAAYGGYANYCALWAAAQQGMPPGH